MTQLEVFAQGDRATLRQLQILNNAPSLIPDSFKDKPGQVDWGAVALACHAARRLDLDPVANLHLFPVIHNTVIPMAEIWRVLARRHGWRVSVTVDTDERVVVHMVNVATGESPPDFELTIDQAQRANTNQNKMYTTHPRSMLRANATKNAIRLNAPEVLQDPAATGWGEISGPPVLSSGADTEGSDRGTSGPFESGDGLASGGPEPTPTIPPRRPADDATRTRLIEAIHELPDDTREDLRRVCIAVELPNLYSERFNTTDVALMDRLIGEAVARAEIYSYTEVIDDQPEARSHHVDEPVETLRYTPEEEAPF